MVCPFTWHAIAICEGKGLGDIKPYGSYNVCSNVGSPQDTCECNPPHFTPDVAELLARGDFLGIFEAVNSRRCTPGPQPHPAPVVVESKVYPVNTMKYPKRSQPEVS